MFKLEENEVGEEVVKTIMVGLFLLRLHPVIEQPDSSHARFINLWL